MKAAMAEMEASGLQRVTSGDQLIGQTYMVDTHCYDVLHFPSDLLDMLEQHPLTEQCHLVLQVGRSLSNADFSHTFYASAANNI